MCNVAVKNTTEKQVLYAKNVVVIFKYIIKISKTAFKYSSFFCDIDFI